ncbi:tricorn interacting aminopeptidase F1 [Paenibacillus sp. BK033]|uniref:alpha/beta fold hydrolase n=1 Tax=Paenibacillus sp. BK033 TaxID=2512133 RepID=UPI0010D01017|nr:alpha/beta fold hydrolase [Paenibacillus sp. BK033]TCM99721.1 tricorn interacting aminopeptidase F1 [Paenibacillus sp. BK033]
MTTTLRHYKISIDGVVQSFHIAGKGPVCLVHPGGPGFNWNYMRMPLLEQTMTVVYIEPIGTGDSGLLQDGDYSMPRYAYFAHKIAEHIGAEKPCFLGHSHGGFAGIQYALDYPNELGGLILHSSAPCMVPELGMEQTRQIKLYAERWPDRPEAQAACQAWMDLGAGAAQDKESFLELLGRLLPAFFGNYWNLPKEFEEWRDNLDFYLVPRNPHTWDAREVLDAIDVPTLILVGEHDFNCGPRWAAEMDDKMPNSQLHTFEAGGHMSHVESPEEFVKVVSDFVRHVRSA